MRESRPEVIGYGVAALRLRLRTPWGRRRGRLRSTFL
jgi:hypothetical protein